jgi:hypothetical protein
LYRNKLWKSAPAWLPITVVLFIVRANALVGR